MSTAETPRIRLTPRVPCNKRRFLPHACPECNGVVDLVTGECARCDVFLPGVGRRDDRYRWLELATFDKQVTPKEAVARLALLRAVYPIGRPQAFGNVRWLLEQAAQVDA